MIAGRLLVHAARLGREWMLPMMNRRCTAESFHPPGVVSLFLMGLLVLAVVVRPGMPNATGADGAGSQGMPPVLEAPSSVPDGMAWIPGGIYRRGTSDMDDLTAFPAHEIHVSAFFVDRFEVTWLELLTVLQWAYDTGRVDASARGVWNREGQRRRLVELDSGWRFGIHRCPLEFRGDTSTAKGSEKKINASKDYDETIQVVLTAYSGIAQALEDCNAICKWNMWDPSKKPWVVSLPLSSFPQVWGSCFPWPPAVEFALLGSPCCLLDPQDATHA